MCHYWRKSGYMTWPGKVILSRGVFLLEVRSLDAVPVEEAVEGAPGDIGLAGGGRYIAIGFFEVATEQGLFDLSDLGFPLGPEGGVG